MKITTFLFLLNFFIFFLQLFYFQEFGKDYMFNKNEFLEGKYYLAFTSIFLHANFAHLIYNNIALLLIGRTVEEKSGKFTFLIIYLISGFIGSLSLLFYKENLYGLGASAAISGLIGFGSIKYPTTITLSPIFIIVPLPFILVGAVYLVINFLGLFIPSQIGYLAHLFGLGTGILFGLFLSERKILRIIIFLILTGIIFYLLLTLL